MDNLLEINNLVKNYGIKDEIKVIKNINFTVKEREFIAIMGRSGGGKSTLLRILGLMDKPSKGKIIFKGENTAKLSKDALSDIRRNEIGFVFQDFYLMDSLSVKENIMLPLILNKEKDDYMEKEAEKYAARFGIQELLEKYPYELSGGERQRAAICRALINNPDIVLGDEPTGNLDSKSAKVVMDTLIRINSEFNKTIVIVTHDPIIASQCSKVIFLKDGVIYDTINKAGREDEFYQKVIENMKTSL